MVFSWSYGDCKSPQVSRTFLSILAVLNNVAVLMFSTPPPTSKSPSPFNNPLVTLPQAPITTDVIVNFMFHILFFNSLPRSFHILSVLFCGQPEKQSPQFSKFFLFLLIILMVGLLTVCMSKSHWSLRVSFSRKDPRLCIYHLFLRSKQYLNLYMGLYCFLCKFMEKIVLLLVLCP